LEATCAVGTSEEETNFMGDKRLWGRRCTRTALVGHGGKTVFSGYKTLWFKGIINSVARKAKQKKGIR